MKKTKKTKKLKNYFALDLRQNMVSKLNRNHKEVNAINGDCQKKLNLNQIISLIAL